MIEELTILSFSKFGSPIKFSSGDLGEEYNLRSYKNEEPPADIYLMRFDKDTYLEAVDGLGVLIIKNEFQHIKKYLFDKQVLIYANVWFSVCAIEGELLYNIYQSGDCQEEKLDIVERNTIVYQSKTYVKKIVAAMYLDKGLDFHVSSRKTSFWQLIYVDKGNLTCTIQGNKHVLNQGDYIFILPNQVYSLRAHDSRVVSMLNIIFSVDYSESEILDNIKFKSTGYIHSIIKLMIEENRNKDNISNDILCSYLHVLLNTIKREVKQTKNSKVSTLSTQNRKSLNTIVQNCIRIIDSNISGDLTVPTIAKYLNVSPSYLSKIFKEEMSLNLSEYVRDYRMEKSKELIRSGEYSLSQISDMLGFCSINYFSAQFKSKYGVPPREYSRAALQD